MKPSFMRRFVGSDEENEQRVRRDYTKKARKLVGRLPFVEDSAAMYYCAVSKDSPKRVKIAIFAALCYFITPIDLIPDAIPITGYLDDGIVITRTYNYIKKHVTEHHRQQARDAIERGFAKIENSQGQPEPETELESQTQAQAQAQVQAQ